jgi:hypothetical protein
MALNTDFLEPGLVSCAVEWSYKLLRISYSASKNHHIKRDKAAIYLQECRNLVPPGC